MPTRNALEKLREAGVLKADDVIVVPFTGFGLKDVTTAMASLSRLNALHGRIRDERCKSIVEWTAKRTSQLIRELAGNI